MGLRHKWALITPNRKKALREYNQAKDDWETAKNNFSELSNKLNGHVPTSVSQPKPQPMHPDDQIAKLKADIAWEKSHAESNFQSPPGDRAYGWKEQMDYSDERKLEQLYIQLGKLLKAKHYPDKISGSPPAALVDYHNNDKQLAGMAELKQIEIEFNKIIANHENRPHDLFNLKKHWNRTKSGDLDLRDQLRLSKVALDQAKSGAVPNYFEGEQQRIQFEQYMKANPLEPLEPLKVKVIPKELKLESTPIGNGQYFQSKGGFVPLSTTNQSGMGTPPPVTPER